MREWLYRELDKVNWRRVWLVVLVAYVVILFGGTTIAAWIIGASAGFVYFAITSD